MRASPSSGDFVPRPVSRLAELMVAVGIFVLGGGVAYPLLIGDVSLYARNFSLNKSDNSLRYSLQKLKKDIDMAIEPPTLVNYTRERPDPGSSRRSPTSDGFLAQGILLVGQPRAVVRHAAERAPRNTAVPVTSTITLNRRVNTVAFRVRSRSPVRPCPRSATAWSSCRPRPYATGMAETVDHERRFDQKNRAAASRASTATPLAASSWQRSPDNGSSSLTVTARPGQHQHCRRRSPAPQSVYVAREVAYVVNTTVNDALGQPHRAAAGLLPERPTI